MKKILVFIMLFISNSYSSINSSLNEAIRNSDLQKVKVLLSERQTSEKEKTIYLFLAQQVLDLREIDVIKNKDIDYLEKNIDREIFKSLKNQFSASSCGVLLSVPATVLSLLFFINMHYHDYYGENKINSRYLLGVSFSTLLLSTLGVIKTTKEMRLELEDYKNKLKTLLENAQEIKQLLMLI